MNVILNAREQKWLSGVRGTSSATGWVDSQLQKYGKVTMARLNAIHDLIRVHSRVLVALETLHDESIEDKLGQVSTALHMATEEFTM